MMRMRTTLALAVLSAALAAPASAQMGGRVSVEPYVGYEFFGDLPETNTTLEADVAFGARAAYQFSPQWALYGNWQRSTPEVTGTALPLDFDVEGGSITVDHWSAGIEFSYVPRGGAEGMLPVLLEAGLGQTRYAGGESDLAVNLGLASALQLSPRFAIRYGANDFVSNFRGDGITNHISVRVGAEITF